MARAVEWEVREGLKDGRWEVEDGFGVDELGADSEASGEISVAAMVGDDCAVDE